MLILEALERGPIDGYGIGQTIRAKSSEVLQVETESLHPALHRLEPQKWVKQDWKLTQSRQRAGCYHITETGKEQLVEDPARWKTMVRAIAALMGPNGEPGEEHA